MGALDPLVKMYNEMLEENNKEGWAPLYKEAADYILNNLYTDRDEKKRVKLTPKDVDYGDGYFIFATGDNSVITFRVEEIPGFLFGMWLGTRETPGEKKQVCGIEVQFFSQFEDAINKFKPSRSNLLVKIDFQFKYDDMGVYSKEIDYEDIEYDMWDVYKLLGFMYKYPAYAFVRDYEGVDFNTTVMDIRTAKRKFEKYKNGRKQLRALQKEYECKVFEYLKKMAPTWLDVEPYVCDRGDSWSPRYELWWCLEDVNKKLAKGEQKFKRGCYGIGKTDNAYKDVKYLRKLDKEYDKKIRRLPGWFHSPFNYDSIELLPRKTIEKVINYVPEAGEEKEIIMLLKDFRREDYE